MFIPEIGTDITLTKDWSFDTVYERRNSELLVRSGFLNTPGTNAPYYSYYRSNWIDISASKSLDNLLRLIYECVENNEFTPHYLLDPSIPPSSVTVRSNLVKLNGPTTSTYVKNVFKVGNITFDIEGEFAPFTTTIPKGTILKVDRIYIRKGISDFSSVSFIVVDSPDQRLLNKKKLPKTMLANCSKPVVRFFAKLKDVNNMDIL